MNDSHPIMQPQFMWDLRTHILDYEIVTEDVAHTVMFFLQFALFN